MGWVRHKREMSESVTSRNLHHHNAGGRVSRVHAPQQHPHASAVLSQHAYPARTWPPIPQAHLSCRVMKAHLTLELSRRKMLRDTCA